MVRPANWYDRARAATRIARNTAYYVARRPLRSKSAKAAVGSIAVKVASQLAKQYNSPARFLKPVRRQLFQSPGGTLEKKIVASKQYGSGRSAGFLKTRRRVKKNTKQYSIRNRCGANIVVERGESISTTGQAQYVGHHSTPLVSLRNAMALAVFNKLMQKACVLPRSSANTSYTFLTDTKITFSYTIEGGTQTTTGAVYQPGSGGGPVSVNGETWLTWFNDPTRPWNATNAGLQFTFLSVYTDVPTFCSIRPNVELRLYGSQFQYMAKSSLKIQNRSISTVANVEADDIDNVPVYGKGYSGKGTGTRVLTDQTPGAVTLLADSTYGVIKLASSVMGSEYNEPPQPFEFANVKRTGKVRIEPGHIKTSILYDSRTCDFNGLFRQIISALNYTGTAAPRSPIGSFRFFGIEKILNVSNTVAIALAVETQHSVTGCFIEKFQNIVATKFVSSVV